MLKFPAFFWALITVTIVAFLAIMVSLGWVAVNSSLSLIGGGVRAFPQGVMFVPKQTPAMVSLLTNPDKLYGWRAVSLPLNLRSRDRSDWQEWEQNLVANIGYDYQQDIKPWLGDEITFAITDLDRDSNSGNGAQPGYLLAAETKNTSLATASIRDFFSDRSQVTAQQYKGANIFSASATVGANSTPWASAVVGNFVLFANQPQIIRTAINQAQAVNLNLNDADEYQLALSKIDRAHVGVAYIDVASTSAWVNKLSAAEPYLQDILSASFALKPSGLLAVATSIEARDLAIAQPTIKSWLDNPELQKILTSLPFDRDNSAYIDLQKTSLLESQIPLYKVTKLAVKSLFPHLKAISIKNLDPQKEISRAEVFFQLDS